MNELIKTIFENFIVDGTQIPVKYMVYEGHGEPYITYHQVMVDNSLTGDDELIGYAEYWDFDIYSKGNYLSIVQKVKETLRNNGFVWQLSRSSQDMYEPDTGYFHKTLCFAVLREET